MNALKGFTKDLTGSSDICRIVSTDFQSLQANAYLVPQEEILFGFESAKGEYAFTNQALICVAGATAATSRRLVERFEYRDHAFSKVRFETTGRIDRDCELKFMVGQAHKVEIDIARKEEDLAKVYYRVLVLLARQQEDNKKQWEHAQVGLARSVKAIKLHETPPISLTLQANETMQWLMRDYDQFNPRCYREFLVNTLQEQQQLNKP